MRADPHTLALGGLLALLVAATAYRTTRATNAGTVRIGAIPGETMTNATGAAVPIILPGGASGRTVYPIRNRKTPNATGFLDRGYFAGYPNAAGVAQNPELRGYWHTGVDMNGPGACSADQGDALYAVRDGVVEFVGQGGGSWGLLVVLRVNVDGTPYWVRYGHVQETGKNGGKANIKTGQTVKAGQIIGYIGRGSWPCAHLHLDVMHTRPPLWGWWPLRNAQPASVTKYCTDPEAWLRRLNAVNP